MKEKTAMLIMEGYQVALGAIMLILATVDIVAHLVAGHLGFVGILVAALMWYIVYSLFMMSVRDYKKTKNSKPENE